MPDRIEALPAQFDHVPVGPDIQELAAIFAARPEADDMTRLVDNVAADQAVVAEGRGAAIRNGVNKFARVFDFLPTVLDPTTLLEAASLTAKAFNTIPQHRRDRMGSLGRAVTRIARLDPVPDVPADTVIENFLIEFASQVVPSWYRTSRLQIEADNARVRAAKEARRRLEGAHRSGWLAVADEWRPLVEAHRAVATRQTA